MVSAPPAPPPFRVSQRFRYRELLGLVAVQSFGNQMTGSFWIVYLVSRPVDFRVATLLWVIAFLTAGLWGLLLAPRRPIPARTGMARRLLIRARRLVPREESFSYFINLRRMGSRTALAFAGQGGVDGLLSVATPLGSFLLTRDSFALGLLFALFSLAAGIAAVVLGRVSDRVKVRSPFLLLGPALSIPACLLAFFSRNLESFAFAIGWLSMTSVVAPSFIYTILLDRM